MFNTIVYSVTYNETIFKYSCNIQQISINMEKLSLRIFRNIGFIVLTILFILICIVAIITYTYRHHENSNIIFSLAVEHHVIIMAGMAIIAVAFGYLLSAITLGEIEKQKKGTKKALEIVMLFLNKEEKQILDFLMKNYGQTTQAEISRLPDMDRVKAHRSLKRMQDKRLVVLAYHGKIKKVAVKDDILQLLKSG